MLIQAKSGRDFLREELARRMGANARYSLRAFAKHLGLSPGELSEVLSGKRNLSARSVARISKALGLSGPESRHLLYIAQEGGGAPELSTALLDEDSFRLVSDWYCFAILSLADCRDFKGEPDWIAAKLGISRTEVDVALDRLARLKLMERKGKRLVATDAVATSPQGVPSEAVKSYHRQILAKATRALDEQGIAEREFGGACFAIDPAKLPALKREIAAFWKELISRYSQAKNQTEVYQLELALFRLTNPTSQRPISRKGT